ncbi:hypothetical protein QUA35_13710 [Microcoleus sp. N9_B2]|uniref:hypothetical protein n=1 Tax=unclassified Microcoleus TaxID=2642155 RepID=UPI002FD7344E
MSSCIYCIDNDIIKKLATFQLFDKTLQLFDASSEQVNILETAQYKFEGDWKKFEGGKSRKPEDPLINYKQVLYLSKTLPKISESDIDQEIFIQLSNIENIDQGEAILTSHAIQIIQKDKSAQIFTGDKRFIKALATVNLPIIKESLNHRLWCLEQLVLRNIEADGFETIRDFIVPVRECDTAIKSVFGSGLNSTSDNSLATLKNYIEECRQEAGNLLNPYN